MPEVKDCRAGKAVTVAPVLEQAVVQEAVEVTVWVPPGTRIAARNNRGRVRPYACARNGTIRSASRSR